MANIYLAWAALDGRGGHAVCRELLARLYGAHVGGPMPAIRTEPMGKPYFAGSQWHFSISHTPRHGFCVLADCPVGLDAEEADREIPLQLAPKILSPGELAQFQRAEDPRRALLTFWVLKEAQGKLTGQGIKWHPNDTDFTLPDSRVQEIDGCLVGVIVESGDLRVKVSPSEMI